jgi:hypothetical protein
VGKKCAATTKLSSRRLTCDASRWLTTVPCQLSSEVAAATTRGWVNAPPPLLDPCLSAFRTSSHSGAFSQNAPTFLVRSTKSGQPNREKWARFARTRPLSFSRTQDFVLCAPRWLRQCRARAASRCFGTGRRCASTPRRTGARARSRARTAQDQRLAPKTLQHQTQQLVRASPPVPRV